MNMHNVKVRGLPVETFLWPPSAIEPSLGCSPCHRLLRSLGSLKCREEERVSLEAILSTPNKNTDLPASSVYLWIRIPSLTEYQA